MDQSPHQTALLSEGLSIAVKVYIHIHTICIPMHTYARVWLYMPLKQRGQRTKLARVGTADLLFWKTPSGLGARTLPRFPKARWKSSYVIVKGVGRVLEIVIGLHHLPPSYLAAKPAALDL